MAISADEERSLSLAEWLVFCLLVKLALLDRAGTDPQPLLEAQRGQLVPLADALHHRLAAASGFERTLALWRYETASATVRFLDAMCAQALAR